ncbi:hypothetical protein MYX82_13145, partial [Acidobacteria bacterium AH-259-D05]|nr:hypothetical protein [Acidobacteria bacterium AH-259-D05]
VGKRHVSLRQGIPQPQTGRHDHWRDKPCILIREDGTEQAYVTAGMNGKVISVRNGFPPRRLDQGHGGLTLGAGEWENGETCCVEPRERWEKV